MEVEAEAEVMSSVKEEHIDRDLEYLVQEIARKPSLDGELKSELQSKRQNSKYMEMLVRDTERRRSFCFMISVLANEYGTPCD